MGSASLDVLRALDGAAIANAIETFGVRLRNEGFADGSIRSLFPDLPPAVGHAVTARIRCSTPPPVGYQYTDRTDWWHYIATVPSPRFVVVEDVDESPGLGGFVGELHATILRALDCVGYATNGAVRDADAVRARVGLSMFASRRRCPMPSRISSNSADRHGLVVCLSERRSAVPATPTASIVPRSSSIRSRGWQA